MTKRFLRRFLSVALSFALLTTALSVGFTAFAAEDLHQVLTDALRAEDDWAAMETLWELAEHVQEDDPQEITRAILRGVVKQGYMTLEETLAEGVIEQFDRFAGDADGVVTLTRTRDEALFAGTRNMNRMPKELPLGRSWNWNNRRVTDVEHIDIKDLKKVLKDWNDTFSNRFLKQDLSKLSETELGSLSDGINAMLDAAKGQEITNQLLFFYGLPTFIDVDAFVQQIAYCQTLAPYRTYAEQLIETPKLDKLLKAQLQAELAETRTSAEALQQLSRTNLTVFNGLTEEYDLAPELSQKAIFNIARALTVDDADVLVATIAEAILGDGTYPAMTYNSTYQTYAFDAAGLPFAQVLVLYERVVLADAALTGSIAGVPNFPGYNVAARLSSEHGIAVNNAPARAIAAIRVSLNGFEPRLLLDYSTVPTGSGWTANLNYDPAPAERAALNAAGGALLNDPGFPPYERMPSAAPPASVKIDPDGPNGGANVINTPNWSIAKGAPEPAVPTKPAAPIPPAGGTGDPAWPAYLIALDAYNIAQAAYLAACQAHAAWQYTQAVYGWIDLYELNDYPAVTNTATPPADNSSRENDAFPITGTYAQKYDYISNLQLRFQLEMAYLTVLDDALRQPETAYYWMQTQWNVYKTTPNADTQEDFVAAARRYYSMLEILPNSTYANKDGAFVPDGLNALITEHRNTLKQIDIVTIYGAFFNAYRLNLEPEDFVRYSNDNLRSELAAVESRLKQFARDYPGEPVPTAWTDYLETVRQAIFLRVFEDIDSLSGEAQEIAGEYDRDTLLSGTYPYNLNNLDLWLLIKGLTLTEAQKEQLALAQQVLACLRSNDFGYETLHWELMAGEYPGYYEDWMPTRGLDDPIVLQVGKDEFHVQYEHVENMINKLDTLISSEWFLETMRNSEFGMRNDKTAKLTSGTGGSSDGLPIPRFNLPKMDGEFLSRLGQMRKSSGELVITDPRTDVKITLPPLETKRNTDRVVDETTGVAAERRWIQSYRADVLLYLLRWMFDAVNTGETGGLEMLSWIVYQVMPPQHTVTLEFWDTQGNLIDRPAQELRVAEGMDFDIPAELMESFELRTIVGEDDTLIDYEVADYTFASHSHDGSAIYGDTLIALYFDAVLSYETLPRTAVVQAAALVSEAVPQALYNALEDVDLSAAVKPFMTELLTGAVSQNLLGDKLPATVLGLYKMIAEAMQPILSGPLLRRPGDTSGRGLIDDLRFASMPSVDLTLGYMLEQIAGQSRYSITVNDLLTLPAFQDIFDFGGATNWLELMLGAQITPKAMTEKLWPAYWPKGDGVVPAGAPAYVNTIAANLSDIYNFLDTTAQGDQLDAWQNYSAETLREQFKFGLETIEDYAEQRQAFEDVMAFAMNGLSFFFSAVFSESPLHMGQVEGNEKDYWYNDLITGLEGVTRGINDLIEKALKIYNVPAALLGLPPIEFSFTLPDLRVSDYVGDKDYFDNRGEVHWRGQFDNRMGVTSTLSAVNAYGKLMIPLFELMGIPQAFIEYSEVEFNQEMAALTATPDDAARGEIARTLTRSLTNPLLNWLAPLDETQYHQSLGYRPLGQLLDLLPNLAYVTEHNIIPNLVNSVLDDLTLDVTLHMGGAGGDSMDDLIIILADLMQYEQFDMNFFLELLVNALPDLLGAGPLLDRILESAGLGMAWIFAVPMAEIVQLPAGSYVNMFRNRNDGNGTSAANEDFFVTLLEGNASSTPGPNTRPATLSTIAGFFGGDSAASSLNFKLFGDGGLQLGKVLTTGLSGGTTLLDYVQEQTGLDLSGDINELLDSATGLLIEEDPRISAPELSEDPEVNEQRLLALDKLVQNGDHAIALLVELFNPQTYPVRDYMNYALLDQAKSRNRVINEVEYSKIWPRKTAEQFMDRLPGFLDNFSAFCFEQTFLDWFYDKLQEASGLDMRQLYTAENLDCLLKLISEHAGKLLPWLNLPDLAMDTTLTVTDRDSFVAALVKALRPAAQMLRIFLIGGRESESPWFGEQYVNNGVPLDLTNKDTRNLGRAGDNLTMLNDYIGVSGYDGYKHGVIPFLEAIGVPQRDILTHEEFVARATGTDGDTAFLQLLIEPLLGVVDRIVSDPLRELPQVLPNLIYFLSAEGGNENMLIDGSAKNGFVEATNRVLRPIYAALDMVTPLASLEDSFKLLGVEYPFTWVAGDVAQDVFLSPDISMNSVVTGLARRWFSDASDSLGLEFTLALQDIMELIPGTLEVFRSVNGQNDAVRLNPDHADVFTHAARRLITLTFSEDNWAEMRLYIAARLPANTRNAVLYLLDALADLVRGMEENEAADMVLAVMYYLFLGKDHLIKKIFAMREWKARLTAFFEKLSINVDLGGIAVAAGAALVLAGVGVVAAKTLITGAAGLLGVVGAAIGGIVWFSNKKSCPDCGKRNCASLKGGVCDEAGAFQVLKPPKTGGSNAAAITAAITAISALGLAVLLLQRPKARRRKLV